MGNSNEFKDVFLKRMFKISSLDSPSDNFTANVMNLIQEEVVQKAKADKSIIEPKYWLLIGLGLGVAAYVLFQMDWSFMEGLLAEINIERIEWPKLPELPKLSFHFLESIRESIRAVRIPTVLIMAVVAVVSLITLDKMLKNRYSTNLFFF